MSEPVTARVKGPFFGMNQELEPTMLGPQYATYMRNVLVDRGDVRVRPGISQLFDMLQTTEWLVQHEGFVYSDVQQDQAIERSAIVLVGFKHLYIDRGGIGLWVLHLAEFMGGSTFIASRGTTTMFDNRLLLAWQEFRRPALLQLPDLATNQTRLVGLEPPENVVATVDVIEQGEWPMDAGSYMFACSLRDSNSATESNATVQGSPNVVQIGDYQLAQLALSPIPHDSVTHIKVYAKVIDYVLDPEGETHGGEELYRLVADVPRWKWLEDTEEHQVRLRLVSKLEANDDWSKPLFDIDLSVRGTGPFAPTRNGLPPKCNVMCRYGDMMLYASLEPDTYGLIFYSEAGQPEHVAADDFLRVPDDSGGRVTAMVVYQGRLIIFKERAAYVLHGQIARQDNANAALGNPPPAPGHQVFRVDDDTGCYNRAGGIGVLECDGLLFVNAEDGVYTFNGQKFTKISKPVQSTWAGIPEADRQRCTMANDSEHGLLWIAFGAIWLNESDPPHAPANNPQVLLCYDYRRADPQTRQGAWTYHNVTNLSSVCSAVPRGSSQSTVGFSPNTLPFVSIASALGQMESGVAKDIDQVVTWDYHVAPIDLGVGERNKLFRYLDLHHDDYAGNIRVESEVEHARGDNEKVLTIATGGRENSKRRLAQRGSRLALRFSGSAQVPVGGGTYIAADSLIKGFAVEAEALGFR